MGFFFPAIWSTDLLEEGAELYQLVPHFFVGIILSFLLFLKFSKRPKEALGREHRSTPSAEDIQNEKWFASDTENFLQCVSTAGSLVSEDAVNLVQSRMASGSSPIAEEE